MVLFINKDLKFKFIIINVLIIVIFIIYLFLFIYKINHLEIFLNILLLYYIFAFF